MSGTDDGAGFVPMPLEDILDRGKADRAEADGGQPDAVQPQAAEPAETGDTPPAEATDTRPRDEHGRFAAKPGEAAPAAPPAAETEPQHVPFAALKDERSKRQASEQAALAVTQERDRLQQQLAEFQRIQAQPPKAPEPPSAPISIPNPAEDPQGYHRAMQDVQLNERLNISEMMAREKYPDVDAKLAVFQAERQNNPALAQQLLAQRHPWDWMYQEAKRIEARKEIGDDPAAYRAKLEAEIRASLQAAPPAPPAAPPPEPPPLPTSLASARSVGERTSTRFRGPTPIEDAVRFKSR